MISRYQVADVIMEISTSNSYILKQLETFISLSGEPADMKVDIIAAKAINVPEGQRVFSEAVTWVKKSPDGSGYFGYCKTRQKIFASIDADAEWKNVNISYMGNVFPDEESNRGIYYFTHRLQEQLANHILLKWSCVACFLHFI